MREPKKAHPGGREYEKLAAEYLEEKGCQILERNYRCPWGEIDLILRDREGQIVFVEVKGRSSRSFGSGGEAVTDLKQQRIRRTAETYICEKNFPEDQDFRFDVILFENGRRIHIEDAF